MEFMKYHLNSYCCHMTANANSIITGKLLIDIDILITLYLYYSMGVRYTSLSSRLVT